MAQLKMYRFPGGEIPEHELPEGYSFSNFKGIEDIDDWAKICDNGLCEYSTGPVRFVEDVLGRKDVKPYEDIFFLDYLGEHIGTVTAFVHADKNIGNVHMVAIRTDFRGKGLGKYLNMIAVKHLFSKDIKWAYLSTDEWRKAAVKSYLNAGFRPVEYDIGMEERWAAVLEEYDIDSVEMYYEDGTFYKNIVRKSKLQKVKFGVFGAGRGSCMINYCKEFDNAEVVAICDFREKALSSHREALKDTNCKFFTDFDEFIKTDMDCVVLANYANEHAPYAVKAMKAGKHVLSEVLPVQNMKEAVELIETVEETGLVYGYAENYAFMPAPKRMRELYREGKLGRFEYGEGEYMHNCEPGWHRYTQGGDPTHWRNTMSAFYYCTHSLGPLIHIVGERPVRVSGFEVPFNNRMWRMGAKAAPIGIEMVTLENGGVIKSLHGVGPAKNSIWYSIYGSKGRMESSREDDGNNGGVRHLYVNCDTEEGENWGKFEEYDPKDAMSELAGDSGHGGSDFYIMYNMVQRIRGNKNADIIDVYEALDMFLPGYFALLSALDGGKPYDIPNLRDKNERDIWRNDTRCTDPKNPDYEVISSYAGGEIDIPAENYEILKKAFEEGIEYRKNLNQPGGPFAD
ncbi:MAG TPA: GNAT family N-acetyltransferase [Clostridiales bacterium]|nr:GNAT family N-acetyltransferase [Clostridiales bacterium]